MSSKLRAAIPLLLASGVAVTVFILVSVFFQNTTLRVLVQGNFSHDTEVVVSTVSAGGFIGELDRFKISGSSASKAQYHGTKIMNLPSSQVQLDFIHADTPETAKEAQIKLSSIQVFKPYMDRYYFSGKYIDQYFYALDSDLGSPRLLNYAANGQQVSVRSISAIGSSNWALILGLPLVFFIGSWFLFRNSFWGQIPAFADMSLGNKISSSSEFDGINGIRGLAALLVLVSHTAPRFESVQMGLALLFVVSGFLLSKPFILDNEKIFSWANIERYVTKRLKRILPMYYFYIFLMYVITFKFDIALRHFFFVQAEGHLWPMTQIFTFYMMLPFILLICCATHRIHKFLPMGLLTAAIYFSVTLMSNWKPFYNGLFSHNFALYAFLMGVLASYMQYGLIGNRGIEPWGQRWIRELLGMFALLVVFYSIAWSAPMKPSPEIFHWVSQFWVKCLASAAIILLVLNTPRTLFHSLIANPVFRSVGVVGFSFYILHGLGMQIFEQLQLQYLGDPAPGGRSWRFAGGAFVVSYIMAVITYSYVERPFFGYREGKSKG